jgi:hypothetical protein
VLKNPTESVFKRTRIDPACKDLRTGCVTSR